MLGLHLSGEVACDTEGGALNVKRTKHAVEILFSLDPLP